MRFAASLEARECACFEDGIIKAMKGLTTIEEVVRVARLEHDD